MEQARQASQSSLSPLHDCGASSVDGVQTGVELEPVISDSSDHVHQLSVCALDVDKAVAATDDVVAGASGALTDEADAQHATESDCDAVSKAQIREKEQGQSQGQRIRQPLDRKNCPIH